MTFQNNTSANLLGLTLVLLTVFSSRSIGQTPPNNFIVSHLSKGLYIVSIEETTGRHVAKLMIE